MNYWDSFENETLVFEAYLAYFKYIYKNFFNFNFLITVHITFKKLKINFIKKVF